MQINYPEVRSPQALGIARETSISRGLLGEPKVRGLGLGLAAAFALGDAACWAGIWKTCLEGSEIRGLGFRHADAATFAIFVFCNGC